MAKRSARDFSATLEQQLKQFKPMRVNPFPLMMDAARQQQHVYHNNSSRQQPGSSVAAGAQLGNNSATTQQGQAAAPQPAAASCTLCSHCGVGLSELQVQQCHACKSVYCSSCSVVNYDQREDRVFCLDCNTDCMQLSSFGEPSYDCCNNPGGHNSSSAYHHQQHLSSSSHQQQPPPCCSPPGREAPPGSSSGHAGMHSLSADRRSSVMRACHQAAAAAAAAADSGGSCVAAMAGISGLQREQVTPLFAHGGLCGGIVGGSGGRVQGGGVAALGQWDLNSPPLSRIIGQGVSMKATPAVLPFTTGF